MPPLRHPGEVTSGGDDDESRPRPDRRRLVALGALAVIGAVLVLVTSRSGGDDPPPGDVTGGDIEFRQFAIEFAPAKPGASGVLDINATTGTVCYELELPGATSGHLHHAAQPDIALVDLPSPPQHARPVCVMGLEAGVLAEVLAEPSNYYVEFHGSDEQLPGGAVRADLGG